MNTSARGGRLRAYLQFVAAIVFFFLARAFARNAVVLVHPEALRPLGEQFLFAVLCVFGYAAFGAIFNRQSRPIAQQGLPLRPGWAGETGIGIAIGWGAVILAVIPLVLIGGIAVVITLQASAWLWVPADAAFFALLALGEEVAFRGYGFQRLSEAVGSTGAAFGFAVLFAIIRAMQPGATIGGLAASVVFSFLLATAYLRTRALWVSWGINFAWKAVQALIFGLTVGGVSSHSPIIEGNPMGPLWLSGGGYGLDASWWACLVLIVAFPVVYSATRDLDFLHNAPVIESGGLPVDLDGAARRQHEAAMGAQAASSPALVQILPSVPAPPPAREASDSPVEPEQRR